MPKPNIVRALTCLALMLAACSGPTTPAATTAAESDVDPRSAMKADPTGPQTEVHTVSLAEQNHETAFLPPLPNGFRDVGGAYVRNGLMIIITANDSPEGPADLATSLVYGMNVRAEHDKAVALPPEQCTGSGADRVHAIRLLGRAAAANQVKSSIGCALARYPGATWSAARLVADQAIYLSIIQVKDAAGNSQSVFTDITDYVSRFPS